MFGEFVGGRKKTLKDVALALPERRFAAAGACG